MTLSFRFLKRKEAFCLDLEAAFDQRVAGVFGPSGSGKTTLLHLLAGIERPDDGWLRLDGRVLYDRAAGVDVPTHQRRIAVVFQEGRLFPHKTVAGNLRYGLDAAPASGLDDIVDLLELGPLLAKRPIQLSGGEAQRVALGRALLSNPDLLLLDEPLASLDARLKKQILPFLRRVREQTGTPMVYVSHDLGELLQLTDQMLILNRGEAAGAGRFLDLVQNPAAFALMREWGLLNVIALTVHSQDPAEGVTRLKPMGSEGPVWTAPHRQASIGAAVHASLRPEDIALVKQPVADISIQNQIRGVLRNLVDTPHGALCVIDAGVPLLAEVTPFAAHAMGLQPGQPIHCLFKAHAVRYLD